MQTSPKTDVHFSGCFKVEALHNRGAAIRVRQEPQGILLPRLPGQTEFASRITEDHVAHAHRAIIDAITRETLY